MLTFTRKDTVILRCFNLLSSASKIDILSRISKPVNCFRGCKEFNQSSEILPDRS